MADSSAKGLHFVIVPFLAQGHLIPMVDISRILAQRGASVTIFATPVNANRFKPLIFRAKQAGLKIQLLELEIPLAKVGLPEGCENFDLLPSPTLTMNLLNAVIMLQNPFEEAMRELEPKPSCIISDNCLHWTLDVAKRLDIPRLVFHGPGCFFLLCWHNLIVSRITDGICNGSEKFVIPGLPDRVEITKGKAGRMVDTGSSAMNSYYDKMRDAERSSYGIIVNSFEELEPQYVKEYQEAKRDVKVLCIGPVSLCNQSRLDKAERGNKASIDEHCCLQWLDSWDPRSVIYVCFGTVSRTSTANMIELALALELSNRPFIWCIKRAPDRFGAWFSSYGFQERVKDKGLIIQGWAP